MPTTPDDIVNEALVDLGVAAIGDLSEGSAAAAAGRTVYDGVLREMFAAAPWNFARRQRQLDMRADRSGVYLNNRAVPEPWAYGYEWPNDCVHFRMVLALNAQALDPSGAPVYAAPWCNLAFAGAAPFVVSDLPWPNDVASDWPLVEGHNPESTRAVLTDQLGAVAVYTGLIQHPDSWPPLFKRAVVATLAGRIALSAVPDKPAARALRGDMAAIAKDALVEARVQDANEAWTVRDHIPDWITARTGAATPIVFS
jgi:hypothetical protein